MFQPSPPEENKNIMNITNFDVHGITQAECMGMGMGVHAPYVPELSDEVQMVCECTLASSTKLQSPRKERPHKPTSPWTSASQRASSSSRSLFDLYHPTAKSVKAANEMALQMEEENMDDLEEMERPRTKFRSCSVSSADDTGTDVTDTDVTDADTSDADASDASDAEASGVSRMRSSSDTHMAEARRHHRHLHCLLSPRAMQQCAGEFKLEGSEGSERREGGCDREGSGQFPTEFEPSKSEPRFEGRLPVDDSYPMELNCPFSDASYDVEELFDIFACLVD